MAVVTNNFGATLTRTPFLKPPDMVRELTAFPRAIANFSVVGGVLDLKPLNDQQEVSVAIDLPTTFAYKLVDTSMSITQNTAFSWASRTYIEITNGLRNTPIGFTTRHAFVLEDVTVVPGGGERGITRITDPTNLPRYVVQAALQGIAPVITWRATNQAAAAATAGTIDFFLSWYEYDIEQVERFPLHYAMQTYGR